MPATFTTSSNRPQIGGDQARQLRSLVARRSETRVDQPSSDRTCHTIVIAGGKGGVGRSVIALNLAVTLAQRGATVGLLDTCSDFGNVEFLAGLNGYWNLSHVLQGCRQVPEVIQSGPAGVRILSGGHVLTEEQPNSMSSSRSVFQQLNAFERQLDWLIVDASRGALSTVQNLIEAADDLLIVTVPEPVAVAEAYATVKSFAKSRTPRLGLLVNQAESAGQANRILDCLQQAAHSFLQVDLHRRGFIPRDVAVSNSVLDRIPFVLGAPESEVTFALGQLAKRWTKTRSGNEKPGFFGRLWNTCVSETPFS